MGEALNVTIFPTEVTWGGSTWTASSGGPLRLNYQHTGTALKDRVAGQLYPSFLQVVGRGVVVRLTLRNVKRVEGLGGSSNLVAKLGIDGNPSVITITFATMVLVEIEGEQGKDVQGDCNLVFEHVSAAQGDPIS